MHSNQIPDVLECKEGLQKWFSPDGNQNLNWSCVGTTKGWSPPVNHWHQITKVMTLCEKSTSDSTKCQVTKAQVHPPLGTSIISEVVIWFTQKKMDLNQTTIFWGGKNTKHAHLTATKKTFKRLRSKKNTHVQIWYFSTKNLHQPFKLGTIFWWKKKRIPPLAFTTPPGPKVSSRSVGLIAFNLPSPDIPGSQVPPQLSQCQECKGIASRSQARRSQGAKKWGKHRR